MGELKTLSLTNDGELRCPRCNEEWALRQGRVLIFNRRPEDRDVTVIDVLGRQITINDEVHRASPYGRRNGLLIEFWCELCGDNQGARSFLSISQSMGQTYVAWKDDRTTPTIENVPSARWLTVKVSPDDYRQNFEALRAALLEVEAPLFRGIKNYGPDNHLWVWRDSPTAAMRLTLPRHFELRLELLRVRFVDQRGVQLRRHEVEDVLMKVMWQKVLWRRAGIPQWEPLPGETLYQEPDGCWDPPWRVVDVGESRTNVVKLRE